MPLKRISHAYDMVSRIFDRFHCGNLTMKLDAMKHDYKNYRTNYYTL
jgi:hypothetical protein